MRAMRRRMTAVLAAAGCALAGAAQAQQATKPGAQAAPRGAAAQQSLTSQDREFMEDAAQSGLAEVRAAQEALRMSDDARLRDFAQRLIDDHTRANRQLRQIAQRKGVDLPSEPGLLQQGRLQLLQMHKGDALREQFVQGFGIDAHQSAVNLFRTEIDTGRDADVVGFARRTLPTLQEHLKIARELRRERADAAASAGGSAATMGASRATSARARPDGEQAGELREVREEIGKAASVVERMKRDPQVQDALARARGVFILPEYGRGAWGVGAQGGSGVLVTREGQGFSSPVFYNMAGVSVGLQAGAAGGPIAMLLMTDRAVQDFRSGKKFSLNADAGLTVVDWSRRGQVSGGKVQDVVVWSGTRGAYAGASVGATDIWFDREANRAYYGREGLDPAAILDGRVKSQQTNVLGMVLAV